MKRLEALEIIKTYYSRPVFNVKIGMCSPEIQDVDFEGALAEFDRCDKFTPDYIEYVFIYASDFCKDAKEINEALRVFGLGTGRNKAYGL